jgi:gluconate 2-dehydrogenase gamma chain
VDADEPRHAGAFSRRSMLVASTASSLLWAAGCPTREQTPVAPAPTPLTRAEKENEALAVLVACAERILPEDGDGPGALAVGAAGYYAKLRDDRGLPVWGFLAKGAAFLMQAAQQEHKLSFLDLQPEQKDDLLRRMQENQLRPNNFSAPSFFRVLVSTTLEAYLCDPMHGGNRDELGWQYVGFSNGGRAAGLARKVGG